MVLSPVYWLCKCTILNHVMNMSLPNLLESAKKTTRLNNQSLSFPSWEFQYTSLTPTLLMKLHYWGRLVLALEIIRVKSIPQLEHVIKWLRRLPILHALRMMIGVVWAWWFTLLWPKHKNAWLNSMCIPFCTFPGLTAIIDLYLLSYSAGSNYLSKRR